MADRNRKTETVSRPPQLLSVPDAAQSLDVSERFVWSLLSTGNLMSVKLGRRRLIDIRDIERFIEKHKGVS